jgi:hypothetical protein
MLISSLTDYRTGHINNFNAAVETWSSPVLGAYKATTEVAGVRMVFDNLPLSSQLPNSSLYESYINDDDNRINTYPQYMIRFSTGALMDLSHRCSQFDPWWGCDVSPVASFSLFVNGQNISRISVPAFTRTRTYVSRESYCQSGDYWDSISNYCDSYSVISNICVKIMEKESGWYLDNSYGGTGCGLNTWEPATYKRLYIYGSTDFPGTVYVNLELRSKMDPRVAFYAEMGAGSTTFGLTQGAKASTGTALFVIGALILFFLCGTAFKLMRLDKHHRYYEEVRAPGMVYAPVQPVQPVVYYQQPQPGVVYAAPPTYPPVYQQPVYYQQAPPGAQQIPVAYGAPHQ